MNAISSISWKNSVWFFDIDDTLIDTAGVSEHGSEGIRKVLEPQIGHEAAVKIQQKFNEIFALEMAGYRVKNDSEWSSVPGGKDSFDNLISQIEKYQSKIKAQYGSIKKWSREVLIKIAADQIGVELDPKMIIKAAEGYWHTMTMSILVFPGALQLIKEIEQRQRPIYLITSSDARLQLDDHRQFIYDPFYSEHLKRQRIELLRQKGISFHRLIIGDPEDKPHIEFFQKGIKIAEDDLHHPLDLTQTIMVGDSYNGDLQTPKEKMGFGLVVLFQKGKQDTEVNDKHQITVGNLVEVMKFINND